MPLYKRSKLTDALHEACGFRTDYQFITRQKMRGIQKEVKAGNKLPYFIPETQIAVARINTRVTAIHRPYYCQNRFILRVNDICSELQRKTASHICSLWTDL